MILGDVDCSLCGLGGTMPTETKGTSTALEVDCPQFMATEGFLANGDQLGFR